MVIVVAEQDKIAEKGFRLAKNGFHVPDFKRAVPIENLHACIVARLKNYFSDLQIKYISSVLNNNEILALRDMGGALRVAIVNSMSSEKMKWFESNYEVLDGADYFRSTRDWLLDEARLLGAQPGHEVEFEYTHRASMQEDFKRCYNGPRHRIDYILRNKKDGTKIRKRQDI